jgi:hypothetical protein
MGSGSKAALNRHTVRDAEAFGQVLRFEPRRARKAPLHVRAVEPTENDVDDFARFEQEQDEPIDYRHRAIMNLIAVVVVTLLVGLGVWIADTISDLQREQDCLMQGRSNCAPIELAAPLRG